MTRVKNSVATRARRKKVLKRASGYFGSKHRLYKTANEQVMHSEKYAFRDRKQTKRNFRKLWITRINAGCRENEISYSRFIDGLNKAGIEVNRKMLSELAIDNPKGVTQYGGVVSAPIARNVLKDIISIYGLKEDINGLPKVYRWDDIKYIMIPDIIGKTKKEARKLLNGFKIEFVGDGDKVIDTTPSVKSRVKEGSIIKVLLN